MIRFIDLRNQGTYFRFAFWDTTVDQFVRFADSEAWDDVAELKFSIRYHVEKVNPDWSPDRVNYQAETYEKRFVGLMPQWAMVDDGKGEEQWEAD